MTAQTKQIPKRDQLSDEMQTFFLEFHQELIKLPMDKRKEKTNQFFNEMTAHFKDNVRWVWDEKNKGKLNVNFHWLTDSF